MTDPLYLTPEVWARVASMLRAFEAGEFSPRGSAAPANRDPDSTLTIKITGFAPGGGKYLAKLMQPGTADVPEAGDLAEEELGTVYTPAAEDAKILALNEAEIGCDTHNVAMDSIHNAIIRRRQNNGTLVVTFSPGGSKWRAQYQHMIHQMVTDNQDGGDYLTSHAMEDV